MVSKKNIKKGEFRSMIEKIPRNRLDLIEGWIGLILLLFLLSSLLNLSGIVGISVLKGISSLIGIYGYIFIVIAFIIFVYKRFKHIYIESKLKNNIGLLATFIPAIALSSFLNPEYGGWVGSLLIKYMVILFSSFFSVVILIILFVWGLVLLELVSIEKIFGWLKGDKKEIKDDEEEDEEEYYDDEDGEYEVKDFDDEEEEEDEEDYEEEEDEEGGEEEVEEEYEEEEDADTDETETKTSKDKEGDVWGVSAKPYKAPSLSLLSSEKSSKGGQDDIKDKVTSIERTLANFGINVKVEEVITGPTFTRYAAKPAEGVRLSKILGLQSNLELSLEASPIRIEAPIPGRSLIGIEVPNKVRSMVTLRSLFGASDFKEASQENLPIALGKDISGSVLVKNLAKLPHLLVAGTTGAGKSVLIHNIILSLLYKYGPSDLRFIMVDPKRIELSLYDDIPHLLSDVINTPKSAISALSWAIGEMEERYEKLESVKCRSIQSYNKTKQQKLPYVVIIIDELADLMQTYPRELEAMIVRLAQKSRAVGIHLVLSTQRPSVNVITGLVKANIPARISLQVASQIDSRTILDMAGAENLVGNGDLLFLGANVKKVQRAQSAFVSEEEVKDVVKNIIKNNGPIGIQISYKSSKERSNVAGGLSDDEDELLEDARAIVVSAKKASTSLLQRKLKIGYSRAARLIDILEEQGIVGPQEGSKAREVLINDDE